MFWKLFHAAAGVGVTIIAILSIIGYITNNADLYHWTKFLVFNIPKDSPAMAINTSICFLLIGIAEIAETIYRFAEYRKITKSK